MSYGDAAGGSLRASVYRRADPAERAPGVVLVHGGGWSGGDRGFHYRHMHLLASRGYVAVNIEYRRHPDAGWRESLSDVVRAVQWVREHSAELGADPDRVAIAGGSAGGHLAALAASATSTGPAAMVLFYPPVDLIDASESWGAPAPEIVTDFFDGELAEASPISHVDAHCPPTLTMCGDADRLVPVESLRRYHRELDAHGVRNRLIIYPGATHGFDLFGTEWEVSAEQMVLFLDEVLGTGCASQDEDKVR